jgi:hypothetical protein
MRLAFVEVRRRGADSWTAEAVRWAGEAASPTLKEQTNRSALTEPTSDSEHGHGRPRRSPHHAPAPSVVAGGRGRRMRGHCHPRVQS